MLANALVPFLCERFGCATAIYTRVHAHDRHRRVGDRPSHRRPVSRSLKIRRSPCSRTTRAPTSRSWRRAASRAQARGDDRAAARPRSSAGLRGYVFGADEATPAERDPRAAASARADASDRRVVHRRANRRRAHAACRARRKVSPAGSSHTTTPLRSRSSASTQRTHRAARRGQRSSRAGDGARSARRARRRRRALHDRHRRPGAAARAEKPVGLVWFGLADDDVVRLRSFSFVAIATRSSARDDVRARLPLAPPAQHVRPCDAWARARPSGDTGTHAFSHRAKMLLVSSALPASVLRCSACLLDAP